MFYTKEELIQKLGLEQASPETQDDVIRDIAAGVSSRLLNKITEKLSDEDYEHVEGLVDSGKDDELEWFLKSKFDHYDEFARQEEDAYIEEIAANTNAMQKAYDDPNAEIGSMLKL